jgi:hypothetical protein
VKFISLIHQFNCCLMCNQYVICWNTLLFHPMYYQSCGHGIVKVGEQMYELYWLGTKSEFTNTQITLLEFPELPSPCWKGSLMNQGWTFGDGKGGIDRYFHLFLDSNGFWKLLLREDEAFFGKAEKVNGGNYLVSWEKKLRCHWNMVGWGFTIILNPDKILLIL